ncbi:MAG: class I SAM-dependent methyltransferase [Myxococcota bacterium]
MESTAQVRSHLKGAARRVMPRPVLERLYRAWSQLAVVRSGVEPLFHSAGPAPEPLGLEEFRALSREFPPGGGVDVDAMAALHRQYTAGAVERRGQQRIVQLSRALGSAMRGVERSLELGCGEGMASHALARRGIRASGIDLRSEVFDPRALADGVDLRAMDAGSLQHESDHFDLVFSFDAFEHFPDPKAVLREAIRVTRPGGLIYLDFGPLYDSAWGLHAFAALGIPYVQHLFEEDTLQRFCAQEGVGPIAFDQCNRWPLARYRDLFSRHRPALEPVLLFEKHDVSGLPLIERYPSQLKRRTDDLEALLVGYIEALFRKI